MKSRPRKSRAEKNHKFLRVGIPFLMALDLLLVANCLGAHRHLREIESKPITEIRIVEKRVELIKEVINDRSLNINVINVRIGSLIKK
jgi:hypothetical protein